MRAWWFYLDEWRRRTVSGNGRVLGSGFRVSGTTTAATLERLTISCPMAAKWP